MFENKQQKGLKTHSWTTHEIEQAGNTSITDSLNHPSKLKNKWAQTWCLNTVQLFHNTHLRSGFAKPNSDLQFLEITSSFKINHLLEHSLLLHNLQLGFSLSAPVWTGKRNHCQQIHPHPHLLKRFPEKKNWRASTCSLRGTIAKTKRTAGMSGRKDAERFYFSYCANCRGILWAA